MTRRPPARTIGIGLAIAAAVIAITAIGMPRLPMLTSRISVCGRDYNSGNRVRSLAEIQADGAPVILVDPGFLGLFPSCPGPDEQGNRPCTGDATNAPCATVVYVRVGQDPYRDFALSGGP